ncbi:SDR family NAD(P)-dependent oxidoreductase [Paraburkholderia dioscoreae]|uniref:NAD(P)-dependent dehydrogenase (Short-subunit alcohol dehydrogenase family) n=1 Tax=Paraburkholderia dioscoreae TaxID=2604047 RepID=A0A5Q4YYB3_9BURK|nr:SDR family oxidoreductase [Paraburkholderia dioscoreae]VVD33694.1 NAD(P)-dependent dehydrogenase (Short-subunit alcohol dehydrogenase family) [Paraburkholderia dioscoreae]
MSRLNDKVAIVTGASSGIGRAIAVHFAREGAKVVVADLHEGRNPGGFEDKSAATTVEEIAKNGGEAFFATCDVTRRQQVSELVDRTIEHFGKLDVIVNNAGIYRAGKFVHEFDEKDLDACWDVNLKGTWFGCQEAIKAFLKSGGGTIVNIVSTAGISGHPKQSVYNISKGAVSSLTKCVAIEYGKDGIRANGICPTYAKTSMTRGHFDDSNYVKAFAESIPLKRWGEVDDVANLAVFLASDESSYIHGALIPVDGGETLGRYSVEDEL